MGVKKCVLVELMIVLMKRSLILVTQRSNGRDGQQPLSVEQPRCFQRYVLTSAEKIFNHLRHA